MRFLLFVLALAACGPVQKPETDDDTPSGPSDYKALKLAFEDLVATAKAGDEAKVLEQLEGYLVTREELVALFGAELGPRVWAGYGDKVAAELREKAPRIIIDQVQKRGLTEVVVEQVGPAYPARTTRGDQAMLDALVQKQAMYTVRLRKPGETLGLRLNGFVFHGDRWRALLKSYDHMAPPPDAAPPPPPPADAGTDGPPAAPQ